MVAAPGLTTSVLPLPAAVPPQLPVYHCQLAPVPRLPPVTVNVALFPEQSVVVVLPILVGAELSEFTVMAVLTQPVLPQAPSART